MSNPLEISRIRLYKKIRFSRNFFTMFIKKWESIFRWIRYQ